MAELSTSVAGGLACWLAGQSVSATDWCENICDAEKVLEDGGLISWEIFAALCERLGEFSHGSQAPQAPNLPTLREIGREIAEAIFTNQAREFPADAVPIEILLIEEAPNFAFDVFPDLLVQAEIASDGDVMLFQVALPEDATDCAEFFELIQGVLEALPLLAGQEPSDVACDLQPGRARYVVRIPRAFENVIPLSGNMDDSFDVALDAVDSAPDAVFKYDENYDEEFSAAMLNRPSTSSLKRAPSIEFETDIADYDGRRSPDDNRGETGLGQSNAVAASPQASLLDAMTSWPDLDAAVEHLFTCLKEHFRCAAAQVWLERGSDALTSQPTFDFGASDKPPTHSLRLGIANSPIGRIDLWNDHDLHGQSDGPLDRQFDERALAELEALVPVYAMAFQALGGVEPSDGPSTPPSYTPSFASDRDILGFFEFISAARATAGEDVLFALATELARQVSGHTALISLCHESQPETLQTAVAFHNDVRIDNYAFKTKGSVCGEVLSLQLTCYDNNFDAKYDSDTALLGASSSPCESFIGATLRDSSRQVVGVIGAWSREPIAEPERAVLRLRVLAHEVEVELQQRHDRNTHQIETSRFRSVVEASRDMVIELSPPQAVLQVSPNVTANFGYTAQQLSNLRLSDLIHPDDIAAVRRQYAEAQHDSTLPSLAFRVRRVDASWCHVEANASSYRTAEGEIRVIVVANDISKQVQFEQERKQMASIIQNSSDVIAIASLNGTLLFLNASGQRFMGLVSDEDVMSKSLFDFAHADDERAMKFEIMPAVHRSKEWNGELGLKHFKTDRRQMTTSQLFMVDSRRADQPTVIAMICRDISDKRDSELALSESEQRYRMLAENPYDLISELDEHGNFIYASPNFGTVLGYSPEMLLGTPGLSVVHHEDRKAMGSRFAGSSSTLSSSYASFRVVSKGGDTRWFETTSRSYKTASDRLMTVFISRDITDRIDSSESLLRTEQKLQQSQKMEAIGRMAGGIAHDFNNLLTAITGYCDLLLEELTEHHPARADAEEILKASERAAGLTHQLLAFSRRQVLQPRIVDLNNLVADMDRMLRRLLSEDIELISMLDGECWPIKADPGQVQQVLLNLVVNARDAMRDGGRITVETANQVLTEPLVTDLDTIPVGDYLTLSVADTGTGMTAEVRAMIFEPFFTTKESGKGTGLGLSTVIGIVQQSGGHIRVDSAESRGSRFEIFLPRVDEVPMLPERYLAASEFRGDETILMVEDSEPVRRLVGRCLERNGYTVLEAASGPDAMRQCSGHTGPIHLVLTDVILPKMDGFEVAKRILALRPDSKVIYMSGFTDDALDKHGLRAQDIALLEKPFTPSTLLRTVREYLDAGVVPTPPMRTNPADDSRD
ncbi:MAG: two-component system cell cycle sensor histidine kinase/response regulator CckA [Myxococcota bacterium]|jgi:two-component system cell cycle sensor histidine kinase/response regulator CckA